MVGSLHVFGGDAYAHVAKDQMIQNQISVYLWVMEKQQNVITRLYDSSRSTMLYCHDVHQGREK